MIKINKAKIVKKETLDIWFTKLNDKGEKASAYESSKVPWHEDLSQSFENLAIHLAICCGYRRANQVKQIETPPVELTEGFHVTSFSIAGDDDNPGFVISGHRILPDGKAVILNTPFRRFEEDEKTQYIFIEDLKEKLQRIDKELRAYMDGSKRGVDPQGKLNFDKAPENVTAETDPAKEVYKSNGIAVADADAMERVADSGFDLNDVKLPPPPPSTGGRKKKPQTQENPAGETK